MESDKTNKKYIERGSKKKCLGLVSVVEYCHEVFQELSIKLILYVCFLQNISSKSMHFLFPGHGELIVGLNTSEAALDSRAAQFIGLISGFNIWNRVLDKPDITWMLHACGESILDPLRAWGQFLAGFIGSVGVQRPATCADMEGKKEIWS